MYGIFSGSVLDNFRKIIVAEKNIFSSKVWHNFAKGKVISKFQNKKTWKN